MNEKRRSTAYAVLLTLLCYLIARFTLPIYVDVDNYGISSVLAGNYGSNPMCQFINPILSWLVYGLSRVFPTADMLLVVIYAAALVSLFLLFGGILTAEGTPLEKCTQLMLVAMSWFWIKPLNANFTLQASWLAVSGILVLCYGQSRPVRAVGTLLLVLGEMLRFKATLLALPFWGLLIAADVMNKGCSRETIKKEIRRYALPLLCFGLIYLVQQCFFQMEPMKSAMLYSNIRSRAMDYPVYDWENLPQPIPGMSEADYKLMGKWVFLYDNAEMLRQFRLTVEYGSEKFVWAGFQELLPVCRYFIMWLRDRLILPLSIFAAAGLLLICSHRKWYAYVQLFLALLGAVLILAYYYLLYRVPVRVVYAVALPCVAVMALAAFRTDGTDDAKETLKGTARLTPVLPALVLAGILGLILGLTKTHRTALLSGAVLTIYALAAVGLAVNRKPRRYAWARQSACLILACIVGCMIPMRFKGASFASPQSVLHARVEDAQLESMGDTVYFTATGSIPLHRNIQNGVLVGKAFEKHFVPLGGWTYGQVYRERFNAENNLTFPANDLLYRPDTYLLADEELADMIVESLRTHYGSGVRAVRLGEHEGVPKWQILPE